MPRSAYSEDELAGRKREKGRATVASKFLPSKSRVFISYSRQDLEFVDRLQAELQECGIEASVDRDDIEKGEKWWVRLQQLITRADSIIFVLSPGSVSSKVCQQEVEFAESLNKRFIPVIARDLEGHTVPDALARLNYIFFIPNVTAGSSGDFHEALAQLVRALETDIKWIREHTRLGELAQRWEARKNLSDLLLRGSELWAAETWLTTRPQKAPEPTDAHRAFITESQRAATRRQRVTVALSLTAVAVAFTLASVAYWQRNLARAERDTALISQSRFLTDVAKQHVQRDRGDTTTAMLLALAALPDTSLDPNGRPTAIRPTVTDTERLLYGQLSRHRERAVIEVHKGSILRIEYSPTGHQFLTESSDDTIRVWEAHSGKAIAAFQGHCIPRQDGQAAPRCPLQGAAFSPDGAKIVIASLNYSAKVIDLVKRREIATLQGHTGLVQRVVFNHDGSRIITASNDGSVRLWAANSGKLLHTIQEIVGSHNDDRNHEVPQLLRGYEIDSTRSLFQINFAVSPNGADFVTTSPLADGVSSKVRLWDLNTGDLTSAFELGSPLISSVAFSPDNKRLLIASYSTAMVLDVASGEVLRRFDGHERWITSAIFSPSGELVLTNSLDGTSRLWKVGSGGALVTYGGNKYKITSAIFNSDGTQILTLSDDRAVRLWNVIFDEPGTVTINSQTVFVQKGRGLFALGTNSHDQRNTAFATLQGHTDQVLSAAISPDGKQIVTGSSDKTIRLWAERTGEPLAKIHNQNDGEYAHAAFSPDGSRLVTVQGRIARLWSASDGKPLTIFRGHEGRIIKATFSPDGTRIATASNDSTARVWDARTGAEIASLRGHCPPGRDYGHADCPVRNVVFSNDGKLVLTASHDQTARLWDAVTGEEIAVLSGHLDWVVNAVFSPSDKQVVTVSYDRSALLWNVATGAKIAALIGHKGWVINAAFSPNGHYLVTTSTDKTARIWHTSTGKQIAVLEGHRKIVNFASFSPDSESVVTGSGDDTARVWRASSGEQVRTLHGHCPTGRHYGRMGCGILFAGFNEDGNRIVTASSDGSVRQWDAASGRLIQVIDGTGPKLSSFASDSNLFRVFTGGSNGIGLIWRAYYSNTHRLVEHAKKLVPRCLTQMQLRQFFLQPEPPRWCITGSALESETVSAKWQPKWPYHTPKWRDWLTAKDRGENVLIPNVE